MSVKKTQKNKILKSSQDARDLINAAMEVSKTYRAAAKVLGYTGNIGALYKMRFGLMRDTDEMRRLIIRRKRRARISFLKFDEPIETTNDKIQMARIALRQITNLADDMLVKMMKG